MTRAQRLAKRGQRKAETLMADTCTIKRVTGDTTNPAEHPTDPGVVVPTYTTIYTGKCKIQNQRLRYPSEPVAGDHQWTVAPTEIHLPVAGTGSIQTGDIVTIDASVDSVNVGRTMRVRVGDRKTHGTALRLLVEEVTA